MWRYIFIVVSLVGLSIRGPELLQMVLDAKNNRAAGEQVAITVPRQANNSARQTNDNYNPLGGRTARARMDRNGHFYFNTRMNGRRVKVVVDTGATGVAINRSTARRLGILLSNSDFKYKTNTANGVTYFAHAIIDEIQIGRIVVYDVRAAVLKDSSLNQTLLGMTFLRKLRKFEINRETLTLTQ